MADRTKGMGIFRQKSLNKISSPDNLDKYIRSTTPSLWLLLGSVILILVGILAWAVFGTIESTSVVGCSVENGVLTAYVCEADGEKIKVDSYIEVNGGKYIITAVNGPLLADESSSSFLMQAAGIQYGQWYFALSCQTELPEGRYKGRAVYAQVSPITFAVN